eukprot:TRINITY_DN72297_c0_g1_i1.p1 TRINITY_DN72297_c0_g1~~TRINITY_DN72297_c0_g1_i1.p1  ORF type:complete len:140 (-),score=8.78 TRINITY_DN72297_c0_g1_i1:290-673(-)
MQTVVVLVFLLFQHVVAKGGGDECSIDPFTGEEECDEVELTGLGVALGGVVLLCLCVGMILFCFARVARMGKERIPRGKGGYYTGSAPGYATTDYAMAGGGGWGGGGNYPAPTPSAGGYQGYGYGVY